MGSWGIPSWKDELDIDYSSLPTKGKKMVRVPIRGEDGSIREVIMEEGMTPEEIPPLNPPRPAPTGNPFEDIQPALGAAFESEPGQMLEDFREGWNEPGELAGNFAREFARNIPLTGMVRPVEDPTGRLEGPQGVAQDVIGGALSPGGLANIGAVAGSAMFPPAAPLLLPLVGAGDILAGGAESAHGIEEGSPLRAGMGVLQAGFGAGAGGVGAVKGMPALEAAAEKALPSVEALSRSMGYTDMPGLSRMAPEGPKKPPGPVGPITPEEVEEMMDLYRSGEGSFFTSNRERAASYPGDMTHVRVPKRVFEEGRAAAAQHGQPTPQDTFLPDEWVKKAAPFQKPDVTITAGEVNPLERQSLFDELGIEEFDPMAQSPKASPGADVPTARIGELERIIASDKPVDVRLQAMMELEDLVPPEVKAGIEEVKRKAGAAPLTRKLEIPTATETVRPANVTPPKPKLADVKNINDVIDTMFGKGVRVKAAQVKEARGVYEELIKTSKGDVPNASELEAILTKRKAPVEAAPVVPAKEQVPPTDVTPEPPKVEPPTEKPAPVKQKPLSEMTPEEMELEATAAESKIREGKPAPDFERASSLRRMAEQKRTKAARDAQIEENRQKSAAATKEAVTAEPPKRFPEPSPTKKAPAPVNPLVKKITEAAPTEKLRPVNPVKVLTGEAPEPKSVSPVKQPKVVKDVDTVSAQVQKETGVTPDNPPKLDTKEGKAFVKSVAKNMGVTEDVAARMVGGQTVPGGAGTKATVGAGTPTGKAPGKIVQGAGKTVPGASGGGPPAGQPPPGGTTPRLPKVKGKRPTMDILSWMRQRRSGDVLAEQTRRRFENVPKGIQTQVDFEAGKVQLPEVRKFLDRQHKLMRRAGVDVGYVENYLTHLWKESPKRVREVLGKRLGLKPGIAMTRSIPTLAEGIQKGLTPKFENMSDVLSWYSKSVNKAIADRGFFEWLRDQKQIKPAGKAPYDWVTLDPDRFPIRKWKGNTVQFKAPKDVATRINEYLYDPASDPRAFIQGLQKTVRFSSFLKNIRLAAGVPFTKLNMHSFSVMAHHVLMTPTAKGVPNIPKMIGRGLKDFGEMLDPRLHKWTNQELSRARLMQKHGPLTLSTEDHVFAPGIKGSLAERLKKSKSIPQAFKTVVDRMFEEPLFQSHLPKMKLNVAWELQREYVKGGMGRKQALEAAGEVTNNMFGGLNLDEMGRSKIGQDLARILVLAPDWLESNLKTVKAVAGSPLGRTPKEKTYRDFATNLLGVYVSGTILQKVLTGRWMHENNPGSQFSIYLGKNPSNGKDRYVKPFGAGLAGVRLIYDSAEAVARREDVGKFGELVRGRMAIPSGAAASTIFNKGPFGQPITKRGDTLGEQLGSVGGFVAGQTVPQYVAGPVAALKGDISPELGLAQSIEFPYTEVKRRPPDERRTTGGRSRRRRRRR